MVIFALLMASHATSVDTKPVRIVSVEVVEIAVALSQNAGIDKPDRCKAYRPSAQQVLMWFNAARPVQAATALESDQSQCLARGTLRTSNGRRYRWELDQAGIGIIDKPAGKSQYFSGHPLPFRVLG